MIFEGTRVSKTYPKVLCIYDFSRIIEADENFILFSVKL